MNKIGLADSPLFETRTANTPILQEPMKPRNSEPKISQVHEPMTPRYQDTMIAEIRKKVKDFGKEGATYRFTMEEKLMLREVTYKYSLNGIRTSENEITRIAINFIVEEYKLNKQDSILARVIEALNS